MVEIPDIAPEFPEEFAASDLCRTIINFCNEASCSRYEILGALENAKVTLLQSWKKAYEEEGQT